MDLAADHHSAPNTDAPVSEAGASITTGLDWVVDDELAVVTHAPERCSWCRHWIDHAQACARASWERFELARREANRDIQQEVFRSWETAEIRLDESRRLNETIMSWLADRGAETRRRQADHDHLADDLTAARAERDSAEARLRRAEDEIQRLRRDLRDRNGATSERPTAALPARVRPTPAPSVRSQPPPTTSRPGRVSFASRLSSPPPRPSETPDRKSVV